MSELIGSLNKIKESGLGIPQVVFPNRTSSGTAFLYLLRKKAQCEKCPNTELFTESPYSVQIQENTELRITP